MGLGHLAQGTGRLHTLGFKPRTFRQLKRVCMYVEDVSKPQRDHSVLTAPVCEKHSLLYACYTTHSCL